ncbi:MAG TPA: alpha/beta fold hydrolase [Candidatus Methanoperedens sp.]
MISQIKQRKARDASKARQVFKFPEVGIPFLWPFAFFMGNEEAGLEVLRDEIKYLKEIEKTQVERPKPAWATRNKVILDLNTLELRDFSRDGAGIYTFVIPPYAGHTSMIVDFHNKQSLVEVLMENGIEKVCAADWKSATLEMKDYSIDNYLADLNVCVDELGGRVNLVGMCQGGWLSAMYGARFPGKVNTIVVGGAPIDTDAGEGVIREYAHKFPMEFYEELVAMGGGLMKGDHMLEGFKSLHPDKQYFGKFAELYEHIEDESYVRRFENFEKWYEYTINLPGRWYLQVIRELFKENRFYKGRFIGLGKKLSLGDIKCPVYLLAGAKDDITPKEQVFNMQIRLGKSEIVKDTADGGHIGLFMGSKPLRENWPGIARWIKAHSIG